MVANGVLGRSGGFALTAAGRTWFRDVLRQELRPGRRPLVRDCLDWTERRPHVAGAVGAAVCTAFLGNGWVTRVGSGRAVRPTPAGRTALSELLGLTDVG